MMPHLKCARLLESEEGSVFVLVAVAALLLVAAAGVAVDMTRAQILSARIQTALDAAGLAAGATANSPPSPLPGFCGNSTWVQCEAQKYFNANFPSGYLASGTVTVTATQGGTNNDTITLSANTSQATTLMQVVGIKTVSVAANSQITLANDGMELVLVLDNTGSMAYAVDPQNDPTTKIQALQQAATQLMGILYGSNTTIPNLWVGMVPFSQAVNIGTGHSSWITTPSSTTDFGPVITSNSCSKYNGTSGSYSNGNCSYSLGSAPNFGNTYWTTNWEGCVMARSGSYDITDAVPSASTSGTLFPVYNFPYTPNPSNASNYDQWLTSSGGQGHGHGNGNPTYSYTVSLNGGTGPNEYCSQQITQMTGNKNTILSAIGTLTAGGDTDLDLGMVWGWRMLSPNWQGLWGGEMNNPGNTQFPELPLAYNTPLMKKVVVFMTDGMDRFIPGDYSGYGFLADNQLGTTNELTAEQTLDSRMLSVCSNMKQNGIIIYTIGFGNASLDNPPTENDRGNDLLVDTQLLQSCATQNYAGDTSHYFLAPTNGQLQSAFQQIAGQLANLRVSQ